MSVTHLSDQAITAFADGVLSGRPRDRATHHLAQCAECAHAVAVQRHAIWALRAAPAPSLPSGLMDRLRTVPATTEVRPQPHAPAAVDRGGSAMFAAFGMTRAAFVEPHDVQRRARSRRRPIAITAAAVAVAGVVAVGSSATTSSARFPARQPAPAGVTDGVVQPASLIGPSRP
jgi:anti-sigma factor RsiW